MILLWIIFCALLEPLSTEDDAKDRFSIEFIFSSFLQSKKQQIWFESFSFASIMGDIFSSCCLRMHDLIKIWYVLEYLLGFWENSETEGPSCFRHSVMIINYQRRETHHETSLYSLIIRKIVKNLFLREKGKWKDYFNVVNFELGMSLLESFSSL